MLISGLVFAGWVGVLFLVSVSSLVLQSVVTVCCLVGNYSEILIGLLGIRAEFFFLDLSLGMELLNLGMWMNWWCADLVHSREQSSALHQGLLIPLVMEH